MSSDNKFNDIPFQNITSPEFCVGYPYLKLTDTDYELAKASDVYTDFCNKLEKIIDKGNLVIGDESFFQIQPKFSNGQPIRGLLGFHLALKIFESHNNNALESFYFDTRSNWNKFEIKPRLGNKDKFASWIKAYIDDEDNDFFNENFLLTSITLLRGDRLNTNAAHVSKSFLSMHLYNHFGISNQKTILEMVLADFHEKNKSILERYSALVSSAKYLFLVIFCREFSFQFTPFWDLVSQQNLFFDFEANEDKILFTQIACQYIEQLRVITSEYNSKILNLNQCDIQNFDSFNSKFNIYTDEDLKYEDEFAEYYLETAQLESPDITGRTFVSEESFRRIEDDYYEQFTSATPQEIALPPINITINQTTAKPANIINIVSPQMSNEECWNYLNKEWGHLIRSFREDIVQLKEQNKINQVSTILVNFKNEILSHTSAIENGHSQILYMNSISFHTYNSVWSSFFEKTIRKKLIDYIVENSELPPLTEDELIKQKLRTELENNQFEAARPNKFKISLNALFEAIEKVMVDAFLMLVKKQGEGNKEFITNHDVKLMSSWYFKSYIKPLMKNEKRIDKLIDLAQAEINTVLHSPQHAMSVVYEANLLTSKKYDPNEILN